MVREEREVRQDPLVHKVCVETQEQREIKEIKETLEILEHKVRTMAVTCKVVSC